MKILFINPCLRPHSKRKWPPVGLACILSAVKKAGFEFELFDMDAYDFTIDDLRKYLSENKYDIVAYGAIVTALRIVKEIAEVIRESNPEAKIIIGNSVATSIPELLLRHTEADIAVLGEGDATIIDLFQSLIHKKSLEDVKGIAFIKENSTIKTDPRRIISNLDDIGFPDWDLFDLARYNEGMLKPVVDDSRESIVYPLNAARGCPYSCTFCYHVFKGQPYRKYSEPAVIEEFKRLHLKYKATFIYFWDELTFPNVQAVEKMVAALETLPFRVGWDAITRADLFRNSDIQLLRRMKDVGCKSISFSIENASPEILRSMKKKYQLDRVVEHSNALNTAGIIPLTSIIFGYPQETKQTIRSTIELCKKCNIYPSVGFLQPLPKTQIYDWALENGFIKDELEYLLNSGDRQDLHVNLTNMGTDEFVSVVLSEMQQLASRMGLQFQNPLKTGVYQKPASSQC